MQGDSGHSDSGVQEMGYMDAPNSEFYFLKPRRRFPGYKPVSMTDVSGRREAMKTSSLARAAWVGGVYVAT